MGGKTIKTRGQPEDLTTKKKTRVLKINPRGKLDFGEQWSFETHRSGWPAVLDALSHLHNPKGVKFDGFIEQSFSWHRKKSLEIGEIPYTSPWIGAMHNPPNMPLFFDHLSSPQKIMESVFMKESLPWCQGLFVFSHYLKNWLEPLVDCPVEALIHPTITPSVKFNWDNFKLNQDKKIVQLGFWLRKLHSIKHLKADGYRKIWIAAHDYARLKRDNEAEAMDTYNEYGLDHIGLYEEWDLLDNLEYDHLLSENIIFLDLYDASANNVVVECIVRNTPILVNRTPGVVEHLGPEYPLFFDSLDEASEKIKDEAVVHDAHVYLGNMDKAQYDFGYFTETFTTSEIYTDLPAPGKHTRTEPNGPPIDTLNDLNVVSGSGLTNDFVFVICFRNQSRKILRSLQSVTDKISKKHNAGIVLIDDASEDDGLDLAIEHLSGLNVDFVAVKNPERKHHPRNLYNAVTLLVENKESVIIEVDGDDYLEQVDLLKILKKTYKKGVLQTFGCCRHAPGSDFVNEFADVEDHIFDDISSPWNMDKCLPWLPLKTYKKSLFNEVPLHCFHEKNGRDWLKTGENLQCHPMMTSLAGKAARFIDKILYVCDFSGPHHDIYHTDRARYLIENLYRLPSGRFIGNCWTKIRNENAGNSHVASIGPRLGSVPKAQSGS